jgi:acetoin utilization deacetylase AcuC-like enzyme
MGPHHPESPERLTAIAGALARPQYATLDRREAPRASIEQLSRVHPSNFIDHILNLVPAAGIRHLDGDTALSPGSGEAALRAAGAVCAAVDAVAGGEVHNAFCAVRPPGHHAEPDQAMGFCIFNNIAVGAMQARAAHHLHRIAVIDFDVHHGNGTQAAFWDDANLFYASTHQFPLYPGTGRSGETGTAGNIVNVPLPPGAGSREFRLAVDQGLIPRLESFQPDMLFISAGFDAHSDDPLANLDLHVADFRWVTEQLASVAERHCKGRLVSTLEGGYDLDALAASVAAHVDVLMQAGRG